MEGVPPTTRSLGDLLTNHGQINHVSVLGPDPPSIHFCFPGISDLWRYCTSRSVVGGFLKWWVSPTVPWVFLLKIDHDTGWEMGGKPTIVGNTKLFHPTCNCGGWAHLVDLPPAPWYLDPPDPRNCDDGRGERLRDFPSLASGKLPCCCSCYSHYLLLGRCNKNTDPNTTHQTLCWWVDGLERKMPKDRWKTSG